MMNKKTYEVPAISVVEIETEEIITASLIGWNILGTENELGYGTIEIDFE